MAPMSELTPPTGQQKITLEHAHDAEIEIGERAATVPVVVLPVTTLQAPSPVEDVPRGTMDEVSSYVRLDLLSD